LHIEVIAFYDEDKAMVPQLPHIDFLQVKCESQPYYMIGNKRLNIISLDKQIVYFRLHWLPASESIVEIFSEYGNILEMNNESDNYSVNNIKIRNGICTIMVEVTEIQRREFPHLIEFECGNSCLVTGGGRPSLCLQCKHIGHIKRNCPSVFRRQDEIDEVQQTEQREVTRDKEKKEEEKKNEQEIDEDRSEDEINEKGDDESEMEEECRGQKRNQQDSTEVSILTILLKNIPPP
jgi:hypothetical protein